MKYLFEAAIAAVIIWLIFETRNSANASPNAVAAPALPSPTAAPFTGTAASLPGYSGGLASLEPAAAPASAIATISAPSVHPSTPGTAATCIACSHGSVLGTGAAAQGPLAHVAVSPMPVTTIHGSNALPVTHVTANPPSTITSPVRITPAASPIHPASLEPISTARINTAGINLPKTVNPKLPARSQVRYA